MLSKRTSVTVNNSPIQNYVHPDDQTQPTFDIFILSDETPSAILEVIINWNVFDDSLTAHSF